VSVYLIDHPPAIRQYRSPRRQSPSGVIVVHTAESFPDERPPDTGAENVAAFIARRTNHGSYHDLVDSDSIIQLVRYSDEAFHDATGSNPHSYGVSAATQAAKWSQLGPSWVDATVRNMAAASARYARWLHAQRGITIPARIITREQSENRVPGFISHAKRDPDRRTDPGATFPWNQFLGDYAAIMDGDDDMPLSDADVKKVVDAVWHRLTGYTHTDPNTGVRHAQQFWHAVRDNPELTASAVWWRDSGLETDDGKPVALWKLLRDMHAQIEALTAWHEQDAEVTESEGLTARLDRIVDDMPGGPVATSGAVEGQAEEPE
jgi:N-acetyl-anhydromuramyl-L-alanine amidase AmpD